jgi:hypothetical protein
MLYPVLNALKLLLLDEIVESCARNADKEWPARLPYVPAKCGILSEMGSLMKHRIRLNSRILRARRQHRLPRMWWLYWQQDRRLFLRQIPPPSSSVVPDEPK